MTRLTVAIRDFANPPIYPGDRGGTVVNPLNAKLNPICHLLALLGAHHILHISRIRVKVLCYKSEGRWFDPRWCNWNFSLT